MIRKGLGKGLGALIPSEDTEEQGGICELKINDVEPGADQPRKSFDDEKMRQLADSIKQHGMVQPIIVKKDGETYKIVAGERRWRAARMAGLTSIPAIIRELTDRESMEIALIENLQREDLNPIEEAEAYERLIKDYDMTQEELAGVVGKSRSAIANSVRLLALPVKIRELIVKGELTSGHARALLSLEQTELQLKAAENVMQRGLNVRDTEKLVKRYLKTVKAKRPARKNEEEFAEIEERLKNVLGAKVKLSTGSSKGRIIIEYYSYDELERLIEAIESIRRN